jgi:hypothetical protein
MHVMVDRSGDISVLTDGLATMAQRPDVTALLVLAADANAWTPQEIDPCLRACTKPVFGGIFPQLLYAGERLLQGTLLVGMTSKCHLAVIDDLSNPEADFDTSMLSAFPDAPTDGTMFVVVDGLARRISALIDALFNNFGLSLNYVGGGGGSLSLVQKPCVITPEGLRQDVALLAWLDLPSGVGVAHGWQPVSPAFRVTESEANVIISLDWRPAFEVYREIVEPHAGKAFGPDNFFDLAKAYPFGIAKLGGEVVVRDPLMAEGEKLICVGEVATGSFVHVLHGNRDTLIAAAGEARQEAEKVFPDGKTAQLEIFVDCISRVLFLEDEFASELEIARVADLPLVGMLSLGEIANSGDDYLEFYNKTSVVALV